jgi:hypothetical protein
MHGSAEIVGATDESAKLAFMISMVFLQTSRMINQPGIRTCSRNKMLHHLALTQALEAKMDTAKTQLHRIIILLERKTHILSHITPEKPPRKTAAAVVAARRAAMCSLPSPQRANSSSPSTEWIPSTTTHKTITRQVPHARFDRAWRLE